MKRDMELVRKILLAVEGAEDIESGIQPEIEGYSDTQVTYHSSLLYKAGLITAMDASSMDGPSYIITGLTWEGHDFLEASRNETVWKKAKEIIKNKGGGMTLDILKQLLMKLLSEQVLS
jgi:DNA-binding transcriptional ArsR family regulator